ncbi:MAG: hypothetical protein JWQ04_1372, partial [Pedosphaera sp.]|nr:hypothetical protein [Pedosphaera sp.]
MAGEEASVLSAPSFEASFRMGGGALLLIC